MNDTMAKNNAPNPAPEINSNFPPLNCPPPAVPNPYVYPYSFIPPPAFFTVPPPFSPHASATHPYPYYAPVNIPPSYHPLYPNNLPNVTCASEIFSKNRSTCKEDDLDLKTFFTHVDKKPSIVSRVKIWEVSRQFKSYYRMLKDLEAELEQLGDENTSVDEAKLRDIASKQEQLVACQNSIIKDPLFLICLKHKINKRKRKRLYRKKKRKSKSRIHVYEAASEHMQFLEQQADHVRQEEKFKHEADNILSSVRQKKADARYQIQLLQNLLKLHFSRVHQLRVETNFTPDTSTTGFEKVLGKLLSLWETKMRNYTTEENGLKLMINKLAVNAEDEDIEKLKSTFDEWLEFIFGTSDVHGDLFYGSYEQLIAIRQGWDKFVVDENDPSGSKIPGGWVIPKYNQNDEWRKFLFN